MQTMKAVVFKGRDRLATLVAPYQAFNAGSGDQTIVTSLCPGGEERMRRLMDMVAEHRVDLPPLITHRFDLDDLQAAFDLISQQRDGVLNVGLRPFRPCPDRLPRLVGGRALDDRC